MTTTTIKPTPIWEGAPTLGLGESPTWLPGVDGRKGSLWTVDITAGEGSGLHQFTPAQDGPGTHAFLPVGDEVASFAPVEGRPDALLIAQRHGLALLTSLDPRRFSPEVHLIRLVHPPYDPRILRLNDGKASPTGDFWVGTYDKDGTRGSLYRYANRRLEPVAEDVGSSNSLGWPADGSLMYWGDTRKHVVRVADVIDGMPGEWREFLRFEPPGDDASKPYEGRPDGGAVDAEGCYWIALYKGSQVRRYSPKGKLLLVVDTSDFTDSPTMVCHGGEDLLTLFITGVNCPVLMAGVEVPGLPANRVRLPQS